MEIQLGMEIQSVAKRQFDGLISPSLQTSLPRGERLQTLIFPLARMRNSTQNPRLGLFIELTFIKLRSDCKPFFEETLGISGKITSQLTAVDGGMGGWGVLLFRARPLTSMSTVSHRK